MYIYEHSQTFYYRLALPNIAVNSLQLELLTQASSKASNRIIDTIERGRGVGCAEEHLLHGGGLVGLEPAAAGQKDVLLDCGQEDLLFDLLESLAGGDAGVLVPVNLDPVLFVC